MAYNRSTNMYKRRERARRRKQEETMAATATTQTAPTTTTNLRRLRKLARLVLDARHAEATAKTVVNNARPEMVELFHAMPELGNVIEAVPGEGIQLVEPVSRKHDEEAIEKYVTRYAPELYDELFPPVRKLDTDALRRLLDKGTVSSTVEKYISTTQGTPQLKRVTVKS